MAAALVGVTMTTAAAAAKAKEVKIGWTAWSDAEAVTRVTKQILEQKMGYKVKLVLLDIALQYSALAKGDIDMMEMAWLPKTHADYYAKVKDKVEDLGVLYGGASLGWVVPAYVPKAQLNSIPDMKKSAVHDKLGGKIIGIDPGAGLMRLSKKAIKDYGLSNYKLVDFERRRHDGGLEARHHPQEVDRGHRLAPALDVRRLQAALPARTRRRRSAARSKSTRSPARASRRTTRRSPPSSRASISRSASWRS